VAAVFRDAFEFAAQVHRLLPIHYGLRGLGADAVDLLELGGIGARIAVESPKRSSNCRARTGPRPSIIFKATNASGNPCAPADTVSPQRASFRFADTSLQGFGSAIVPIAVGASRAPLLRRSFRWMLLRFGLV